MARLKLTPKHGGNRKKKAAKSPSKKGSKRKPRKRRKRSVTSQNPSDLVVFAFRLTANEREAIHAAAGPAKASQFARQILAAAAAGDVVKIKEIIEKGV